MITIQTTTSRAGIPRMAARTRSVSATTTTTSATPAANSKAAFGAAGMTGLSPPSNSSRVTSLLTAALLSPAQFVAMVVTLARGRQEWLSPH